MNAAQRRSHDNGGKGNGEGNIDIQTIFAGCWVSAVIPGRPAATYLTQAMTVCQV